MTGNAFSMLCDDGIGCLTVIYDTHKVGKVLMPPLRKRQDWGLWLMILKKCRTAYGMKEPLAIYRQRTDSISSKKNIQRYIGDKGVSSNSKSFGGNNFTHREKEFL